MCDLERKKTNLSSTYDRISDNFIRGDMAVGYGGNCHYGANVFKGDEDCTESNVKVQTNFLTSFSEIVMVTVTNQLSLSISVYKNFHSRDSPLT